MALLKIKDIDGIWQTQGNVGVFGGSCDEMRVIKKSSNNSAK